MNYQNKKSNGTNGISGRRIIRSMQASADAKRTPTEKAADLLTHTFGTMTFLIINAVWFFGWILVNLGVFPSLQPFDPFPFGLLTMIVSLEAIILSVIVLISQNRASKVDDLREEVDLQIDVITEKELTKLMRMVSQLLGKNGIDTAHDTELQKMLQPTDMEKIKKALEKQVDDD